MEDVTIVPYVVKITENRSGFSNNLKRVRSASRRWMGMQRASDSFFWNASCVHLRILRHLFP